MPDNVRGQFEARLDKLIAGAQRFGLELQGYELADAFWLAARWPVDAFEDFGTESSTERLDESESKSDVTDVTTKANQDGADAADNTDDPVKPPPSSNKLQIRAQTNQSAEVAQGGMIRTPAPPPLQEPLQYVRAVLPIAIRGPSRIEQELDIDATVKLACSEHIWTPVYRPVSERIVDLTLILDAGPSMHPWRSMLQQFNQLVHRSHAFRQVNTWHLDSSTQPHAYQLRRNGVEFQSSRLVRPDAQSPHLIVVCSDCVSPAWHDGSLHQMTKDWSRLGSVVIGQVLPPQLWDRTSLALAEELQMISRGWMPSNRRMNFRQIDRSADYDFLWDDEEPPPDESESENEEETRLPIPVFSIDPKRTRKLSRWLSGKAGIRMPGYFLQEKEHPGHTGKPQTPGEVVREFQMYSTRDAVRLATLLAAAPAVSLPISRLIQQTVLGKDPSRLAEAQVWLSGLLEPIESGRHSDPEQSLYRFRKGILEELRKELPKVTGYNVLQNVSQYIEENLGRLGGFRAMLTNPGAPQSGVCVSGPIAEIAAETLTWLGGDYARAVRIANEEVDGPTEIVLEYADSFDPESRPVARNQIHCEIPPKQGNYTERDTLQRFQWSPNGESLAIPTRNGMTGIWFQDEHDARVNWRSRSRFGINAVSFSPDGDQIALACFSKRAEVRFVNRLQVLRLDGHQSDVTSVAFRPGEKTKLNLLATATAGGSIRIWDVNLESLVTHLWLGAGNVNDICWISHNLIAVGTSEAFFIVFIVRYSHSDRKLVTQLELPMNATAVASLNGSHIDKTDREDSLIAVGTMEGDILVVEADGTQRTRIRFGQDRITGLEFQNETGLGSDSTEPLLAVKSKSRAAILSISTGDIFWELETSGLTDSPYGTIAFNPVNPRIIAVSTDGDRVVEIFELPKRLLSDKELAFLRKYGQDLKELVGSIRSEDAEEFESDIDEVIHILTESNQHPVITNNTSLDNASFAAKIANRIEMGKVPEVLLEFEVILIDTNKLAANPNLDTISEFSQVLGEIIDSGRRMILVLEDLADLNFLSDGYLNQLGGLIKPAVNSGQLKGIGFASTDILQQLLESVPAIESRLKTIVIPRQTTSEQIDIKTRLQTESLRIRILGSVPREMKDPQPFHQYCRELGEEIAERGHTLVISSTGQHTADFHVCQGFQNASPAGPIIYIAQGSDTTEQVINRLGVPANVETRLIEEPSGSTFILSHHIAFDNSDALILISGGGNALRGFEIGDRRNVPTVCVAQFGGAAQRVADEVNALYKQPPYYMTDGDLANESPRPLLGFVEIVHKHHEDTDATDKYSQVVDPNAPPWSAVVQLTLRNAKSVVRMLIGCFIGPSCIVTDGKFLDSLFIDGWIDDLPTAMKGSAKTKIDLNAIDSIEITHFGEGATHDYAQFQCYRIGDLATFEWDQTIKADNFIEPKALLNTARPNQLVVSINRLGDHDLTQWKGEIQSTVEDHWFGLNNSEGLTVGSPLLIRELDGHKLVGVISKGNSYGGAVRLTNRLIQSINSDLIHQVSDESVVKSGTKQTFSDSESHARSSALDIWRKKLEVLETDLSIATGAQKYTILKSIKNAKAKIEELSGTVANSDSTGENQSEQASQRWFQRIRDYWSGDTDPEVTTWDWTSLTRVQLSLLRDTFLDAYSPNQLDRLVRGLGFKLDLLISPDPQRVVVRDLLRWAEENGKLQQLVQAAIANSPHNEAFQAIAKLLPNSNDASS